MPLCGFEFCRDNIQVANYFSQRCLAPHGGSVCHLQGLSYDLMGWLAILPMGINREKLAYIPPKLNGILKRALFIETTEQN